MEIKDFIRLLNVDRVRIGKYESEEIIGDHEEKILYMQIIKILERIKITFQYTLLKILCNSISGDDPMLVVWNARDATPIKTIFE